MRRLTRGQIRVLHQMTQFIMMHPEKIRDKIAEMKDADHDQSSWVCRPTGAVLSRNMLLMVSSASKLSVGIVMTAHTIFSTTTASTA